MTIKIKLIAGFQVGRFEDVSQFYKQDPSVRQVIKDVGLSDCEGVTALINGIHARPDERLSDQDTLTLLPFIDGG